MKKISKNKNLISYVLIFIAAILICIPLFNVSMNIINDDGIQHLYRIVGVENSIKECFEKGSLFPVIMSNLCNGFGYSWNIFYSPLTAYVPLIFKVISNSYILGLKLFLWFTIFMSGIYMYKFVSEISKNKLAGVISAVIYMCAPYHLTDVYTRVSVAELCVFVFLPMLFLGLHSLKHKNNYKQYYIAIAASGLVLSHNILTIYAAIYSVIYLLFNFKVFKKKSTYKSITINVILIILCTSFYWAPLLEHKLSANYEVFEPNRMYSESILDETRLSLENLFLNKKDDFNFTVGFPAILGIILCLVYSNKLNKHLANDVLIFLGLGFLTLFFTSNIVNIIKYLPNNLKMIQFMWRLITFSSFFLSIVAGIGLSKFVKRKFIREALIMIFLVINIIMIGNNALIISDHIWQDEEFINPVPVLPQTGRVHAGMASFEYLPVKAFQNRNYIEERSLDAVCLDGEAYISNCSKDGSIMSFEVKNAKNAIIELPYIYYLGYEAYAKYTDGQTEKLNITESDKGFCMINTDKNAIINVRYVGTTIMKISLITSIIGGGLIIYYVYYCKRRKNVI